MARLSISSMSTLTGSKNNNSCVIPIVDIQTSDVSNQNKKINLSTHNQFYSNNNGVSGLSSYGNYFGTGADGDLTISSSAQVSASFNNTLDGDIFVKNYKSLTINFGSFVSPLKRCRGLIIYCTGNLTVAGTLSMTGKGGGVGIKIAAPIGGGTYTDARYDLVDGSLYLNNLSSSARGIPTHWNWAPSGSTWFNNYKLKITNSGSVGGGASKTGPGTGNTGTAGVFCCGGGGGGGSNNASPTEAGEAGGRGTIFAGGGGGGGGSYAGPGPSISSTGKFDVGGRGGSSYFNNYGGGGGGAGSPAGPGGNSPATSGSDGAGGLLIIIVRGNVTITGTISNNGTTGGTGGVNSGYGGGGGGGSGGGSTIILYGGTYSNSGTVTASGGTGGAGGAPNGSTGGTGGAGAITVRKIHT